MNVRKDGLLPAPLSALAERLARLGVIRDDLRTRLRNVTTSMTPGSRDALLEEMAQSQYRTEYPTIDEAGRS